MQELILRAKAGEELAIEEIAANYKGLIRSVANKFYLVGGDKDDLLQEGMMGLYFAILNFDESRGAFPAFVKLCVVRQIINAVKMDNSDKNKPLKHAIDISSLENMADEKTPVGILLEKELSEKIANAEKENLSSLERQVLELFAEGYSYEDISEKLNKSYKAVDGALQRARKKLLGLL